MNVRPHLSEAAWLAIVGVVLVWSWIGAYDPGVWVMEVLPVFIAVPVLAFTRSRFPLTPLVYALILVHAIILMVGGHYTYARVPLGFWLQEWFDFSRNHYDRIGHLAQGFIPAMVAREILLRQTPLQPGGWLFTLVTSVALAISAVYEFIEWWAALALGAGADEFLATQGDPFDTQADMLMATLGAMLAQALLARWHDRQLARLRPR
jgi:putative membrane protein